MQMRLIFTKKVLHLASFWKWEFSLSHLHFSHLHLNGGNCYKDIRELKQRRRRRRLRQRQQELQKRNRFRLAKQQLCTCITVFCNFHCRRCTTYDVKLPNLTFYGGREHKTAIFFFFSWTSIQSIRIQLQKSSPLFVELKPGKVWSSANSLFKWRFCSRRRRCCLSSLISIKRPGERAQRGGETALLSLYSRYESAPKNRTLLLSLSSPVFRPHDSGTLARILAIG